MYLDSTYLIFVLPAMLLAFWAQFKVNSTYEKFSKVQNHRGITGAEVAVKILNLHGIYNVRVEHISGKLSDHFDPRSNVIRLSDGVYSGTSVAALGVAAHETGHAIQHAKGYAPLKFRSTLVPAANIGAKIAWPLILVGLLINSQSSWWIIQAGIIAFSLAVLFQIVTLPVEFNASGRAIRILEDTGMMYGDEIKAARKVLSAAALTYVASAASSILQLLRLILLVGGRRRND